MKRRLIVLTALAMCLVFVPFVCAAHADSHGKCKMSYKKEDLKSKIFNKAHFMLMNEKELGLSDAQVKSIKDLKLKAKKDMIKQNADIAIVAADIKAMMYEDPADLDAIDLLIEKKYELKKAKAKYMVQTYTSLKNILTSEQKEKLKELWKK